MGLKGGDPGHFLRRMGRTIILGVACGAGLYSPGESNRHADFDSPMAEMALNGTTSFSSDAKVHPGEVLREDFLKPLGMSANALAKALSAPAPRINDVVRRRGISADTAMRLARYFGSDARSWLNLQTAYDLRVAEILPAYCVHRRSMHTGHLLVPTRRDVSQVLPDDNQRSRRSA